VVGRIVPWEYLGKVILAERSTGAKICRQGACFVHDSKGLGRAGLAATSKKTSYKIFKGNAALLLLSANSNWNKANKYLC
jgi:hypothetical protein